MVLVFPFVLQVFGAVALVGFLSFRNGQRAVNELAGHLIDRTSEVVNEHLQSYLAIPQKLNQINAAAVRRGLLDVRDRATVEKFFWDQMQSHDLTYIGMGLTTGEGVGVARYDGETITIDDWTANLTNNITTYATDAEGNRTQVEAKWFYDMFNEPWYTEPVAAGMPIWAKIITGNFPTGPYISASASRPIYDAQNQLLGMIAVDIHLLKLSEFLRDLNVSQAGEVFIMNREGTLIASSGTEQPFKLVDQQVQQLQAVDSPNVLIQTIAKHIQSKGLQAITDEADFELEAQKEPHFVNVTPWRDAYGLDWLVVVSVPESAFMAQIHENTRVTIALCVAALAIASGLGVFTSRWIMGPILRLNQASKAMAAGDLSQVVEPGTIREFNTLSTSFNHMVEQLNRLVTELEHSKDVLEDRVEERTSDLKNALAELKRTQAQVVQSEKMSSLGQLVAGVAHEINNPVNFIHGNLNHVRESVGDLLEFVHLYQQQYSQPTPAMQAAADEIDLEFLQTDIPKMLASMQLGTDRIRQIVLSLRNFSRMDESEFKAVDIHEGIDSTLLILQHRLKAQPDRPAIEIVRDYGSLPLVECYAGQLNQVFMNILVNSIDALEERDAQRSYEEIEANPSCITIRTSVLPNKWIEVAIADNGSGIPFEIQQNIFDPFFTTKPMGKGTGMGMSISFQIVTEKHGGKLECFSTPGEGAEFRIAIPFQQVPVSSL
ncbi:sensor histidine kinase [Leptolyngbya sp. AN02str]|uniref:sensor histidine kinase n=1 Tax=Leptolyngbya sp. AN02str TaxID=3423363 RepID=UPI003D31C259